MVLVEAVASEVAIEVVAAASVVVVAAVEVSVEAEVSEGPNWHLSFKI